jgi:predicted RNase H-like HicB family nuclease
MKRKVLLYPGEDGYFVVEVPSLLGCVSQGKTREEALANIEEAMELYVAVLHDWVMRCRRMRLRSF